MLSIHERAQLKGNVSVLMTGKTLIMFRAERNFDVYLLIRQKKGGRISGNVKYLNYKSPMPSGALELPLLLTLSCPEVMGSKQD